MNTPCCYACRRLLLSQGASYYSEERSGLEHGFVRLVAAPTTGLEKSRVLQVGAAAPHLIQILERGHID